jgi:hypothetical protein
VTIGCTCNGRSPRCRACVDSALAHLGGVAQARGIYWAQSVAYRRPGFLRLEWPRGSMRELAIAVRKVEDLASATDSELRRRLVELDARYKVIAGTVCPDCEELIRTCASEEVLTALKKLAGRQWLFEPPGPLSPAATAAGLRYDLFATKGVSPGLWERLRAVITEEATKEMLKVIFALILAALALKLSLKTG